MKSHHRKNAARLQHALCCKERAAQFSQFVIDEDAQTLKNARSRMDLVAGLATDGSLDQLSKLGGGLEWTIGPHPLNGACDAACVTLLTQHAEDAGQIANLETVDHIGCRQPGLSHAHVERSIEAEGEAALSFVKLHGGDANIEHDAIDAVADQLFHPREGSVHQS